MGLTQEILQSHEQLQEKDSLIAYLRRRLFGQKQERYIDLNQGELFPDSMAPALSQVKPEPEECPCFFKGYEKELFLAVFTVRFLGSFLFSPLGISPKW